jgi:hypothetical protein
MSKGAFQTRLGQMGEIPNFQQTPPMAYTGNYFMPPKPNYLPIEKQAMARVQQPMSIQQPIANIMAEGSMQQPMAQQPMAQQPSFQQQVPSLLSPPEIPRQLIQTQPQSLLQTPGIGIEKPTQYDRASSRISLPPINSYR